MANPDKKPITIDDSKPKVISYSKKTTAELRKEGAMLQEHRSITLDLLDSESEIDKTKLEKIKLRLKTGYYYTGDALNKIADRIANVFIGIPENEILDEEKEVKSKRKIKKYSMAKDLVEEFAGIWDKNESEISSIEFAKELRIKANSRTK